MLTTPNLLGGTGKPFNWALAREANRFGTIILAGGLTPENVGQAIREVRPFAVDVASGVESVAWHKDAGKLRAFFQEVERSRSRKFNDGNLKLLPVPDARGWFGEFGGRFAPETLMAPVEELEAAYRAARNDPSFQAELARLLKDFAGRPTPLFHAQRLTARLGGAQIYLKREDLLHTGAHKINNCLGQGLLAQRMGKTRLVAETGAGQHGVATATVAALLGMECVVYMGEEDMARQAPNVFRMRLLGTKVVSVSSGTKTLKDAINEGMRDWVTNVHNTHYLMGSVLGPHPYPMMVRDFHRIIGQEARRQVSGASGETAGFALRLRGRRK